MRESISDLEILFQKVRNKRMKGRPVKTLVHKLAERNNRTMPEDNGLTFPCLYSFTIHKLLPSGSEILFTGGKVIHQRFAATLKK